MSTNQTLTETSLLGQLRWRYATKAFDPERRIPAETWRALEEALILTPSSFGLQPWRFLVITDRTLRERLVPVSWGQRQVADASQLVVFTVKTHLGEADVDQYLGRIAEVRGVPIDSLKGFREMLTGFLAQPKEVFHAEAWATRQVYIALGNFMTSAALLGIDTCPMEGIEPARYDEILGLAGSGYRTVVVAAAGYRSAQDKYAQLPKVRFEAADVVRHLP